MQSTLKFQFLLFCIVYWQKRHFNLFLLTIFNRYLLIKGEFVGKADRNRINHFPYEDPNIAALDEQIFAHFPFIYLRIRCLDIDVRVLSLYDNGIARTTLVENLMRTSETKGIELFAFSIFYSSIIYMHLIRRREQ